MTEIGDYQRERDVRLRMSYDETDLDDDQIQSAEYDRDRVGVVVDTEHVDTIPQSGDWCVVSADGELLASGCIDWVSVDGGKLKVVAFRE